jgi:uncharacterized protein YcbX
MYPGETASHPAGAVLSAKREPLLLLAAATVTGEGVTVRVPGADPATGSAACRLLTQWLGRPVTVTVAPEDGPAYVDAAELHVVGAAEVGAWDVRRFRPNLVVTGVDPTELVGRRLDIGTTTCEVISRTRRCGMTTAEQPGLRKDVGVLRSLARDRDLCLGVYARVVRPGEVAVGDGITMR